MSQDLTNNPLYYHAYFATKPTLKIDEMQHRVITQVLAKTTWQKNQLLPPTTKSLLEKYATNIPTKIFDIYHHPLKSTTEFIILSTTQISLTIAHIGTPDLAGIKKYIDLQTNYNFFSDDPMGEWNFNL